jgi:ubiquitin-activating enzyme E1
MLSQSGQQSDVDENLYSRQLYVIGVEAMKKLATASVLVCGLGGLGIEIAKNLVLAGVQSITIHDCHTVQLSDLVSNFYLTRASIGQNRAVASRPHLAILNGSVSVSATDENLTEDLLKTFACVVLTDRRPESEIRWISQLCHHEGIKFILAETQGLFGFVFVGDGPQHVSVDPIGETPSRFLLSNISRDERGLVTIADGEFHGLRDGDFVRFEEVEGMEELNGRRFEVSVVSSHQFYINCDTRRFGVYQSRRRSGYGNQECQPKAMTFLSLLSC